MKDLSTKDESIANGQFQLTPVTAALLIGLSMSSATEAAIKPFRVDQTNPTSGAGGKRIAIDGAGNSVLVWATQAYYVGGNPQAALVFRRYDRAGIALGAPAVASLNVDEGYEPAPSTACNKAGKVVIVWFSGTSVLARRLGIGGAPDGPEITVNETVADETSYAPRVAIDGSGKFVVVWSTAGGILRGRLFGADGNALSGEITLNDQDLDENISADVAMDENGNFAATWLSGGRVLVRRFSSTGSPLGSGVRADLTREDDYDFDPDNVTVESILAEPVIAMDETGDFAIAWDREEKTTKRSIKRIPKKCYRSYGYTYCNDAYDLQVYKLTTKSTIRFRRFAATGLPVSALETEAATVTSTGNFDENDTDVQFASFSLLGAPSIAMDRDGDFTVAWVNEKTSRKKKCYTSYGYKYCENIDTYSSAIQAQKFKPDGKSAGKLNISASTKLLPFNLSPSVTMGSEGDLGVSWFKGSPDTASYTSEFWAKTYPVKMKK